jgi:putative redox protein
MSNQVAVAGKNLEAKYQVRIASGSHVVVADEPAELGGGDTGMSPYQLLAASLAACTAITLRMYAERKGWATGEISVDVALDTDKGNTELKRKIGFGTKLSEEEHTRMLAVANACPVHKVLTGSINIVTE